MTDAIVREAFRTQAEFCRRMDAPVTAAVCTALAAALSRETVTGARVLDWPGDPIRDALPLRLVGGLHAMAMRAPAGALATVFADGDADAAAVLGEALVAHDAELAPWLEGPPQTNEAGRSAVLMLGLMAVARRFGQPFEILEIGSSAGLNLLMDRIAYDLGGVRVGPAGAPIAIAPEWRGAPPLPAPVAFASLGGCDQAPIDATDPAAAERLRAYVWAEKHARLARIDAAIAMLAEQPVRVEHADATDWLDARLAEPQVAATTRVLVHSVVWQYLGPERQGRIRAAMTAAGGLASPERPLAWVRMEPRRDLARHELWVEQWPGGSAQMLALAHAHGEWIEPALSAPATSQSPH